MKRFPNRAEVTCYGTKMKSFPDRTEVTCSTTNLNSTSLVLLEQVKSSHEKNLELRMWRNNSAKAEQIQLHYFHLNDTSLN